MEHTNHHKQKLKLNVSAQIGLFIILSAVLLAIFAYRIAPDCTPDADQQLSQISGKLPFFKVDLVRLKKKNSPSPISSWKSFWTGTPSTYTYMPIRRCEYIGKDSIRIEVYRGERLNGKAIEGELKEYSLNSISAKPFTISKTYWLGTDKAGRDVLSRLLIGTRISLGIGLMAVLISISIGVIAGALAGYFGGKIDGLIMAVVNVLWSIPTLLMVFAIVFVLGKGMFSIFIAVGLTMWVEVARTIRGQVLSLKERNFVEAAHSMGFSHFRILFYHILPNTTSTIVVLAASNFATAILIEAGLSYLGIGINPPTPSWGSMLSENKIYLAMPDRFWIGIIPGIPILLLVLSFNWLGNGIRDITDVKAH